MDTLNGADLSIIFDTIPNPIFIKDENLYFIFVNKAYEKMFDVKKTDVVGKQVIDIKYLPKKERLFYQKEDTEVITHIKTKHHIFEYLYRGREMHTCLYWSSGFIQANGKHGLIGIIVDINRQSTTIRALRNKLRITNLEKQESIKKSAIDALTQIYTRQTFDRELRHLVAKEEQVFSCLMLDVDHFKKVNDTFGHVVGDAVLKEVASAIRKTTRKPDNAYRYGGEEFVVLLPDADLSEALVAAERIRSHICGNVRTPDGLPVTVSVGCSEHALGESGESVVHRADKALYEAKNTGRNRVCS